MSQHVNVWAKHFQNVWTERAHDYDLPAWLRVASYAYGRHSANGHAPMAPGELMRVLATVDKRSGEMRPNANASRAVSEAVKRGWLRADSTLRCLVVPSHAIDKGFGSRYAECKVHGRADAQRAA